MSDFFISYSRKDREFVRRLHDVLAAEQRDVWVDWEDIPPTAEWLREIRAAIEGAQAFVFVISPDSVASTVCGQELAHAVGTNKRLIPLVCREVDPRTVPEALARLNWIFCREGDDFEASVAAIVNAMETDLEWVREHTRLLIRAGEWEGKRRDRSFLLQGKDLQEAEEWLARRGAREPLPTPLQTEYVIAGRRASTKRQRIQLSAVSCGLAVSIALSILAVRQANIATSRELAAAALNQLDKDPELGLLLACEAADKKTTGQAEEALRQALFSSHLRIVMAGNAQPAVLAVFNGSGTRVAGASEDGTVVIWDAATGARLLGLPKLTPPATDLLFTPDGRILVTVDDSGAMRLWDAATGAPVGGATTDAGRPFTVQGRAAVAVRRGATVALVDAVTGTLLRELPGAKDPREIAALSHDGAHFATIGNLTGLAATITDSRTGAVTATLLPGEDSDQTWRVAFSPDGKLAVTITRWIHTESGGGPTALGDKSAWLWEVPGGKLLRELRGHTRQVNGVVFSPNGLFVATASDDGTARVWEADTGRELAVMRGHRGWVTSVAFSPDGSRLVTTGADGTVRVWDATTGRETPLPARPGQMFTSVAVSPDGTLTASTDYDGVTTIRETGSGKVKFTATETGYPLAGAAFSPDGKLAVSLHGDQVKVWNTAKNSLVKTIAVPSPEGWKRGTVSRDGRLLALISGNERTVSGEGEAVVVDLETGARKPLAGDVGPLYAIAFSPDARQVVTAGESGVPRLWTLATGASVDLKDGGHTDRVLGASFSPDGRTILTTGRDTTAKLWDTTTARKRVDLLGHDDAVISGFFSPDGAMVATVGADGTIRLWDAATGKQLARYGGFPHQEPAAAFVNGGRSLVAISLEGFARVYDLGTAGGVKELLTFARKRVTRQLTPVERETFLHVTQGRP